MGYVFFRMSIIFIALDETISLSATCITHMDGDTITRSVPQREYRDKIVPCALIKHHTV
jgi:hypothetical protein